MLSAEGKQTLLLLPQAQPKTVRKRPLLEENNIRVKLIVAKRLQYFFVSINSRVAGHTVQLRADGVALCRVGGAQEPSFTGLRRFFSKPNANRVGGKTVVIDNL